MKPDDLPPTTGWTLAADDVEAQLRPVEVLRSDDDLGITAIDVELDEEVAQDRPRRRTCKGQQGRG